jgi:regulator of CtrA degradation
MAREDAASEKYRLGSKEICRGKPIEGADQLPAKLLDLLARSEKLYDRVERLDDQLYARHSPEAPTGVIGQQMRVLETAFGAGTDGD